MRGDVVDEYEWKGDLLKNMRLDYIELEPEDWILLLLAVDGFRSIEGKYRIHYMLFIYHYAGFQFKSSLLGVYSESLDRALEELISYGYVRAEPRYTRTGIRREYSLTEKGRRKALELMSKVRKRWILVSRGLALRRGDRVLSELEAVKHTYVDRSVLPLVRILLEKVTRNWPHNLEIRSEGERELVKELCSELSSSL